MRRFIFIFTMLFLGTICAEAQHYDRGYELVPSSPFLKKGVWMAGGTASYSQHINDDFNFLLINNINSTGYSVAFTPKVMYMFKDNMGAGLRFSYDCGALDLSSAELSAAGISMGADDCYQINHGYSVHGFYRTYIPLAGAKRIAMFADLMIGGTFGQGKVFNTVDDAIVGSYQKSYALEVRVDPGIIAFLTERIALELNVGIFGVSQKWTNQIHNQIDNGTFDSISAGFMINPLSIGVGMSYYFL